MSGDLSVDKLILGELRALRDEFHAFRGEARQDRQSFENRLRIVELAVARHVSREKRERRIQAGWSAGAGGSIVALVELARHFLHLGG